MRDEQSFYNWRIARYLVVILLSLMLLMYHQTVSYLTGLWSQLEIGEYGHGYLILAISGYLIFQNKRILLSLTPCPSYPALLAVLAASLLWLLAVLVDVQMVQTVGLLLLVLAIVWTLLGTQVTWELLFAILFMGFAIPIWFPLAPFLQDLSADVVFQIIRILGIPAFRLDNEIILPAGSLSVTEACSGLRYLLAALSLGTFYAYINYTNLRARLIVITVSAVSAVLANILRIFIVVYLGYTTEMQHPFVKDHLSLGWYLFGAIVVILLVLDFLLNRQDPATETDNVEAKELTPSSNCEKGNLQRMIIVVVACALLLSAGPVIVFWIKQLPPTEYTKVELEMPLGIDGWKGPAESENGWMPDYQGAIARKQAYQKAGKHIDLYMGFYLVQKQGEELINELNRISNKDAWHSRNPKGRLRQLSNRLVLEQLLEKEDGEQRLVWYWYRVAGRDTVGNYQAKLLQLLGLITGNPQASIIAIAVKSDGDINDARLLLNNFVSAMEITLTKFMDYKHN